MTKQPPPKPTIAWVERVIATDTDHTFVHKDIVWAGSPVPPDFPRFTFKVRVVIGRQLVQTPEGRKEVPVMAESPWRVIPAETLEQAILLLPGLVIDEQTRTRVEGQKQATRQRIVTPDQMPGGGLNDRGGLGGPTL